MTGFQQQRPVGAVMPRPTREELQQLWESSERDLMGSHEKLGDARGTLEATLRLLGHLGACISEAMTRTDVDGNPLPPPLAEAHIDGKPQTVWRPSYIPSPAPCTGHRTNPDILDRVRDIYLADPLGALTLMDPTAEAQVRWKSAVMTDRPEVERIIGEVIAIWDNCLNHGKVAMILVCNRIGGIRE